MQWRNQEFELGVHAQIVEAGALSVFPSLPLRKTLPSPIALDVASPPQNLHHSPWHIIL